MKTDVDEGEVVDEQAKVQLSIRLHAGLVAPPVAQEEARRQKIEQDRISGVKDKSSLEKPRYLPEEEVPFCQVTSFSIIGDTR